MKYKQRCLTTKETYWVFGFLALGAVFWLCLLWRYILTQQGSEAGADVLEGEDFGGGAVFGHGAGHAVNG